MARAHFAHDLLSAVQIRMQPIMVTLTELMGAYDWKEAMKYAEGFFDFGSIERVLYSRDGENDEARWLLLAELKSGGYGILSAWCDYTGWGCQEGGEAAVLESLETAIARLAVMAEYNTEKQAQVAALIRESVK